MNTQMIENITKEYYSQFCGIDLTKLDYGIHFICSSERDKKLKGFGCKYAIYIFVNDSVCVVSCSPKHKAFIEQLKECGKDEIILAVKKRFELKRMKLMMFEKEAVTCYGNARILKAEDYPLYEAFFRATYPDANPDEWLYEYFIEKTDKEYFVGYLSDRRLLSVCDAPDMPYMEDKIQHTGINTLEEERRKGYAACTAALAAHHLICHGSNSPQLCCDQNFTEQSEVGANTPQLCCGEIYLKKMFVHSGNVMLKILPP